VERRERTREAKSEKVAHIENAIEKELLERFHSGTYEDIYNYPMKQYKKNLDENEEEIEYVEEEIEESDEEIEDIGNVMTKKMRVEEEYEQEFEELDKMIS
jgi:protein MAK16